MSDTTAMGMVPPPIQKKSRAALAGWLCLLIGMVLMFVSLTTFLLYGPLFLAAFILSIVSMAHRRIAAGVLLMVAALAVPTVSWIGLVAVKVGSGIAETQQAKKATLSSIVFEDVTGSIEGNYMYCRGKVRNNGSEAVKYVKVQVEWLDGAGTVLDTDYTFAVSGEDLSPGGAKSFEIMSRADSRMERFRYHVIQD